MASFLEFLYGMKGSLNIYASQEACLENKLQKDIRSSKESEDFVFEKEQQMKLNRGRN